MSENFAGFIVHAWRDGSRLCFAGRLDPACGGGSFAILLRTWASRFAVPASQKERAARALAPLGGVFVEEREAYQGETAALFAVPAGKETAAYRLDGLDILTQAQAAAEHWLAERGICGMVRIQGEAKSGRFARHVFVDPVMEPNNPSSPAQPPSAPGPKTPGLVWLSIDIETSPQQEVRAISLFSSVGDATVFVIADGLHSESQAVKTVADERALLAAANEKIRDIDPDVITGWNVLDFDLAVIFARCKALGLPWEIGRSDEAARVHTRPDGSCKAFIPGRQAVDALRVVRGMGIRFEDQRLETVARNILGEGKLVASTGSDKLEELEAMWLNDRRLFAEYCLRDAELVMRILDETGLHRLTECRAGLTGVSLDLAWTSIPAFEKIYGIQLERRNILPPPKPVSTDTSGAAGGTVLEPLPGCFSNVLLFDFRSLYPSLMRTFNIDPLVYERSLAMPDRSDVITAPNGASFARTEGILPALISDYFSAREKAIASGDETAAYVYKILMNSFYGVLGASRCLYARTELAGAITSWGRFWLHAARDWFTSLGHRVLYGDTDSVFVELSNVDGDANFETLAALGRDLASRFNDVVRERIRAEWRLESRLQIRSEKVYRSFMIPRIRFDGGGDELRGRAKGYAGWILGAGESLTIEVKGMEAARSDYTALARRFQTQLLERLFGCRTTEDASSLEVWIRGLLHDLHAGALDEELVYQKVLRRAANEYTKTAPPQVRAARVLGWTNQRGAVRYRMTRAGPQPMGHESAAVDYGHYVEHQLRPIWDSLLGAVLLGSDEGRVPDVRARLLAGIRPFESQLELLGYSGDSSTDA